MNNDEFPSVQWEDDEPTEIEIILNRKKMKVNNQKLTEEKLAVLGLKIQKIAEQCDTVEMGLKLLICALATFADYNSENEIEFAAIMDCCRIQLTKLKKLSLKEGEE